MPVPDPTPEEPMDPEFLRLVGACCDVATYGHEGSTFTRDMMDSRVAALHRWHREQVERAGKVPPHRGWLIVSDAGEMFDCKVYPDAETARDQGPPSARVIPVYAWRPDAR